MARNGSGTYSRVAGVPYVYNTVIDQVVVNSEFDDIATALTASIAKDGQTTPTANLPMGGYLHTGVAAATARTHYARAAEVQDGSLTHLTSVSGADTITASASLSMAAYATGQKFSFVSAGANTGAATLNINSIGAKAITKNGATALAAGDIPSGAVVEVAYDGTQFQLLGVGLKAGDIGVSVQAYSANIATTAASQAEMESGTEAALRSMSPLRVAQAIAALGGGGTDQVARDQIALTNIRLMLNTAITTGALVQGKQWELATDEWGASSTNEAYTAPGSFGYYSNLSATSYANSGGSGNRTGSITVTNTGFVNGTNSQVVDGTTSGSNGLYPNGGVAVSTLSITFDFGAGASKIIQEVKLHAGASFSIGGTWQWQGSNDGSSFTNIGSTFTDTAAASQVFTSMAASTTGYRHFRLQGVSGTTGTAPWWNEFEFKIADAAAADMTLIPDAAVSVSSAPTYMDGYFLWKDDSGSASLGTDLTAELSRDNGTTYTTATLTNMASYDGTYSIIKARASVASQPSGTSMLCRIKTLNNKAQRIAAPALYAE